MPPTTSDTGGLDEWDLALSVSCADGFVVCCGTGIGIGFGAVVVGCFLIGGGAVIAV